VAGHVHDVRVYSLGTCEENKKRGSAGVSNTGGPFLAVGARYERLALARGYYAKKGVTALTTAFMGRPVSNAPLVKSAALYSDAQQAA